MPQNLPDWAKPSSPSPRPRTFDSQSRTHPPDDHPYGSSYSAPRNTDNPFGEAEPLVIWPPPGEEGCGTCDVSGLTINGVDCDENPTECELTCCSLPAPDECAPALSQCSVPLPGEAWVLLLGALLIGFWYHRTGALEKAADFGV